MQNGPVVIIGDLINSKKIENRKEVQQKLNAVLHKVNHKYKDLLIDPFKVTLGDEFVGVLKAYEHILDLLHYIDIKLAGIEIRYGIGYGKYEGVNKGQAYKNALKAIEVAKKTKFKTHLIADSARDKLPIIINIILHLYFKILSGFNGRQKYIIYEIARGKTQKEIADLLGTSQSSISQSLDKINWRLLFQIYEMFYNIPQVIKTGKKEVYKGEYIAFIGAWPLKESDEESVKRLLDAINQNYSGIIRSRFIVTTLSSEDNDYYEFQGLIYNDTNFFNEIFYLIAELFSELRELYLGIGIGGIATEIKDNAMGMDGTAFYRAREAIGICFSYQMQFNIKLFNTSLDKMYSLILCLLIEFIKSWSPKQSLAVRLKQTGLTQNEIKDKMNLSARSTVVEHLQRAGWQDYKYIIESICDLIKYDKTRH